jgi:hypothetical protein
VILLAYLGAPMRWRSTMPAAASPDYRLLGAALLVGLVALLASLA